MCCGQKRTELRNSQAQWTTRSVPPHGLGNSQVQAAQTQPSALLATHTASPRPLANPQTQSFQPHAPALVSVPQSSISVRYLEKSPIRLHGVVSGMYYEFSGSRPIQRVDARDAPFLLSTRFFRRAP